MLSYSYLKLKLGAPVEDSDGVIGHLHQLIFSPLQQRIVAVVIRAHLLPLRDWVLPIELIADANDERVILWVRREDILKQPMFDPSLLSELELETTQDDIHH